MSKTSLLYLVAFVVLLLGACGEENAAPGSAENLEATVLYDEDFDDGTSCFAPAQDPVANVGIENGELIMSLAESRRIYWTLCDGIEFSDFDLEFDLYAESTGAGFHFIGLMFRQGPREGVAEAQYYIVRIGMDEGEPPLSCVGLASESSFEAITEGRSASSYIGFPCWLEIAEPFESGRWQRVRISADGPQIHYAVNGVSIATINDGRLEKGRLGLLIGTHDAAGARFKIDNLLVTELAD